MKKLILSFTLLFAISAVNSQSVETGNQQIYYEKYQSAENTFRTILQQQPNEDEAWFGHTRVALLQEHDDEAANTLYNAPSSVRDEPFYQVAYGYLMMDQGKTDSATLFFEEALDQTRSKNASVLAAIAAAHIETKAGNASYAIEIINKAIKRDKNNPALYVLLGDAYLKLKNGSDAYTSFKEAISRNDKHAAAYHRIGEIFLSQKSKDLYLEYFNKAVTADPMYAPSLYKLYSHYFYFDAAKALDFYNRYVSASDASIRHKYDLADLYYLTKEYDKAIAKANSILETEKDKTQPRLFKLLGYSYAASNDSATAQDYMKEYFAQEADSNFIAKDFEIMADLYLSRDLKDSAVVFLTKAAESESDTIAVYTYYNKLANLAKEAKDYAAQAKWLGMFYNDNEDVNNLNLFNWGLAHYRAGEYEMADSVFGMYVAKYPEQSFGYYWEARSNAARDSSIEFGLAVPHYQKLVEVLQKDSTNANYKTWMIEAYGYLAAYEVNTEKDYTEAVDYFEKVLQVDPENENAKKYIALLEQTINGEKAIGAEEGEDGR